MTTHDATPDPAPVDAAPALSPATLAVVAGRPAPVQGAPVNPPVVLSSTYVSQGPPVPGERLYTRMGTETWEPFEEAVAALEGGRHGATVFGSGMAAVAAVLALVPLGGAVVVPRHAYQATLGLLDQLAVERGLDVTRALDDADLLWVETPTNPMLEVADLPALVEAAHARHVLVAVDSTFATPLVQRPFEHGADIVVHSATKYLAGHSDVVLGIALAASEHLTDHLRAYRTSHGAIAGPFEVWLALRGLRTLALRVERAQANAAVLAARLAEHPDVVEVRHPSLPQDPGHDRAARLMDGFGAILGVRPRGGADAADAVVAHVALWTPATSLGGVESTLERRRRFGTESVTVPEDLLRLSVGVEDIEDLWADLDRALRAAQG